MTMSGRVVVARCLFALLALAHPPSAEAGVRPRYGGALRVLLPASPAQPDPARATSPTELAAVRAAHATLLEVDEHHALRPGLLEALPEPEDGARAWRLRLAPALRFQDGQPIAAADVAASLARLGGPGSAHSWLTAPIAGSAAVRLGNAALLSGVQVLSDRELRIALSYPFPGFAEALATLPSALVRAGAGGALVGAGPFQPAGVTERGLRLAPFDGFHGGRPFADALILAGADVRSASRALADGAAEVVCRPESLDGRAHLETGPLGVVLAVVSRRLGPAAEATRNSLAALDRRDLARLVRAPVVPLPALLPPALLQAVSPRGTPPRQAGAPAARLKLLLPEGADAPRATAARIQVKLYDRGVRAAIETAPAATFAARLASGDFDVALVPVWLVSRTPAIALAQIAAATGGPEWGARAFARVAGADADALPSIASALETELLAVPLYATGLRFATGDAVEGLWLHDDGTPELGDAWLMPRHGGGP
jgi:MarR-like DNA-binding transcriptional regulator SgrR of sgrS sRNA